MMRPVYLLFLLLVCLYLLSQCGENDDTDPVNNTPPLISELIANPDTVVVKGTSTITCVANDPDSENLTYIWESVTGQSTGQEPKFEWTAPDSSGIFTISCIVVDEFECSDSSFVDIVVLPANHSPIIVSLTANPDTIFINESTTLLCSATDPDQDSLIFEWQATHGSFKGSGDSIEWTAPDLTGTFTINCTVRDGNGGTDNAEVEIIVKVLPIANAGPDQEVLKHMIVALDGSESSDPYGNALTYKWSFISKPDHSTAEISDDQSPNPIFIANAEGTYVLELIVNDGMTNSAPDEITVTVISPSVSYQLQGINFSPYMDDQDPNLGVQISEAQLRNRMAIIAPYTQWIRTFGSTHGLEKSGELAHSMELKTAIGAWLSRDIGANEQEIANLIEAANAGHVDIAIVGSEVLLRGDLTVQQLIDYINQVRNAIPNSIPVTTAEVCDNLLAHPDIIAAVDLIFFNHFSYWDGVSLNCAVASLHSCYQELVEIAQGKPIMVSETGWPSCGNEIGNAVPSPENASQYFLNVISWARANDVPTFYFEAFDELWKAAPEGPQGACWGTWDKDGNLKPGMQAVFDGETIADNWSENNIPGGPGTPEIEFTFVPEINSYDNLIGQVWHVLPSDYKVAVYILVAGRWWTKPNFAQPLTNITCDGSFITDITTGGIDQRATKIAAYLVPKGYDPPPAGGIRDLPLELDENSIAKVEVDRN